jgi:hypothetical protein
MCECISIVNAVLQPKGLQLVTEKRAYGKPVMTLGVERTQGPVRFDNRTVSAAFCPICGERY